MRIKRLISGGQTGVDRAALDTAIKFNVPHGGWVPAGRLAEDGPVSEMYGLWEMDTALYEDRTLKNVTSSDATIILARGELRGGTLLTESITRECHAPLCHLDLLTMDEFEAALLLHQFFDESDGAIAVLNVAGPRASEDPFIYRSAKAILEAFLFFEITRSDAWKLPDVGGTDFEMSVVDALFTPTAGRRDNKDGCSPHGSGCKTPQDAVLHLARALPFRMRSIIANLKDQQIGNLYFSVRDTLTRWLGMDMENSELLSACRGGNNESPSGGRKDGHEPSVEFPMWPNSAQMDNEDAVMFILKALQNHLRQEYRIRRITSNMDIC